MPYAICSASGPKDSDQGPYNSCAIFALMGVLSNVLDEHYDLKLDLQTCADCFTMVDPPLLNDNGTSVIDDGVTIPRLIEQVQNRLANGFQLKTSSHEFVRLDVSSSPRSEADVFATRLAERCVIVAQREAKSHSCHALRGTFNGITMEHVECLNSWGTKEYQTRVPGRDWKQLLEVHEISVSNVRVKHAHHDPWAEITPSDEFRTRSALIKQISGNTYIIRNLTTKYMLLSDGDKASRVSGGWDSEKNMVYGADANYYNRCLWRVAADAGGHVQFKNQETNRLLMMESNDDCPRIKGFRKACGGWEWKKAKVLGADSCYYWLSRFNIRKFQKDGKTVYMIQHLVSRNLLMMEGDERNTNPTCSGGYGPTAHKALGADANYYDRALWLLEER